jgi:hypothetical protein
MIMLQKKLTLVIFGIDAGICCCGSKLNPTKKSLFCHHWFYFFDPQNMVLAGDVWYQFKLAKIFSSYEELRHHCKMYIKSNFLRWTNNFISLAFLLWSCCCCCSFFLLQNHLWKMSLPIYLCRAKNKNPFSQIFFFVCCRCDDKTFSLKDMNGLIFDSKLFFWIFFSRERVRFTSGPPKALAAYANA